MPDTAIMMKKAVQSFESFGAQTLTGTRMADILSCKRAPDYEPHHSRRHRSWYCTIWRG
jgi:hypothetical protein